MKTPWGWFAGRREGLDRKREGRQLQ